MPIMVASVTMNGWIRRRAITAPLSAPTSGRQPATAARIASSDVLRVASPAGRGQGHGDQRGRERQDAADAEIDAAGQDDERHGQRDNADQRDLPQNVGQIAELQKNARTVGGRGADHDGENENAGQARSALDSLQQPLHRAAPAGERRRCHDLLLGGVRSHRRWP